MNLDECAVLASLLRDDQVELHEDCRELFGLDIFDRQEGLPSSDRAQLAYDRLRLLIDYTGSAAQLATEPRRLFALHEWAAVVDCTLAAVLAGHYSRCLGAIAAHRHDSEQVRSILAELGAGDAIGVFLGVELGSGNDPSAVQSLAELDPATGEFVLRTPAAAAQKLLADAPPSGVAVSGIVLARLVAGGQEHGIYPFVMRLSTAEAPAYGVWITPVPAYPGWPLGTGLVSFHGARLPFDAMLGTYPDTLRGRRDRVLQAAGHGHVGDLCRSSASLGMAKAALALAIRFGVQDRTHRERLLAALADTLAAAFLQHAGERMVAEAQDVGRPLREGDGRRVAMTKLFATRTTEKVLAACREWCGVPGMVAANRIAEYVIANQVMGTGAGNDPMTMAMGLNYEPAPVADVAPDRLDVRDERVLRYLFGERERRRHRDRSDRLAIDHIARLAIEEFLATAARVSAAGNSRAAVTLQRLAALHALRAVQADAAWFVSEGLLTPPRVRKLVAALDGLVAELAPELPDLVAAFDIPDQVLRPPIVGTGQQSEPTAARS